MIFLLQTVSQNLHTIKKPLSDNELIDLLKGGNPGRNQALELVYQQNRGRIFGYVLSNSGTTEEATDIFQETVIAFYENVKQDIFKGESAISTYLYSIARFKWLNQIKKNKVRDEHHNTLEPGEQKQDGQLTTLIKNEKRSQVLEVIALLGADCKTILVESIYHQTSMKDIAAAGNFSSEQVVRNKKYKCIKKLKELIKDRPALIKILRSDE